MVDTIVILYAAHCVIVCCKFDAVYIHTYNVLSRES